MVTFDIFLLGVLFSSLLTGLVTEAAKKLLDEHNKKYYTNTLAAIVAVITSVLLGVGYVLVCDVALTTHIFVYFVALIIASWLCAMVGRDKVIQTLTQFKKPNNEGM